MGRDCCSRDDYNRDEDGRLDNMKMDRVSRPFTFDAFWAAPFVRVFAGEPQESNR